MVCYTLHKELVCPCTPVLKISMKANDHHPLIATTYINSHKRLQNDGSLQLRLATQHRKQQRPPPGHHQPPHDSKGPWTFTCLCVPLMVSHRSTHNDVESSQPGSMINNPPRINPLNLAHLKRHMNHVFDGSVRSSPQRCCLQIAL